MIGDIFKAIGHIVNLIILLCIIYSLVRYWRGWNILFNNIFDYVAKMHKLKSEQIKQEEKTR